MLCKNDPQALCETEQDASPSPAPLLREDKRAKKFGSVPPELFSRPLENSGIKGLSETDCIINSLRDLVSMASPPADPSPFNQHIDESCSVTLHLLTESTAFGPISYVLQFLPVLEQLQLTTVSRSFRDFVSVSLSLRTPTVDEIFCVAVGLNVWRLRQIRNRRNRKEKRMKGSGDDKSGVVVSLEETSLDFLVDACPLVLLKVDFTEWKKHRMLDRLFFLPVPPSFSISDVSRLFFNCAQFAPKSMIGIFYSAMIPVWGNSSTQVIPRAFVVQQSILDDVSEKEEEATEENEIPYQCVVVRECDEEAEGEDVPVSEILTEGNVKLHLMAEVVPQEFCLARSPGARVSHNLWKDESHPKECAAVLSRFIEFCGDRVPCLPLKILGVILGVAIKASCPELDLAVERLLKLVDCPSILSIGLSPILNALGLEMVRKGDDHAEDFVRMIFRLSAHKFSRLPWAALYCDKTEITSCVVAQWLEFVLKYDENLLRDVGPPRNMSLLHAAIQTGELESIKLLLSLDPKMIFLDDGFGRTPLFASVRVSPMTWMSLESGRSFATRGYFLSNVPAKIEYEIIDYLLDARDDPAVVRMECLRALQLGWGKKQPRFRWMERVQYLLREGVIETKDLENLVPVALKRDSCYGVGAVLKLLRLGAPVSSENYSAEDLVVFTLRNGSMHSVFELSDLGVSVSPEAFTEAFVKAFTPFPTAFSAQWNSWRWCVETVTRRGIAIPFSSRLRFAVSTCSIQEVSSCLRAGSSDSTDFTPLMKVMPRLDSLGRSLVIAAADGGFLDVVQFLVGEGCDLSVVDSKGRSVLHALCGCFCFVSSGSPSESLLTDVLPAVVSKIRTKYPELIEIQDESGATPLKTLERCSPPHFDVLRRCLIQSLESHRIR